MLSWLTLHSREAFRAATQVTGFWTLLPTILKLDRGFHTCAMTELRSAGRYEVLSMHSRLTVISGINKNALSKRLMHHFSVEDSNHHGRDLNFVLHEGSPTSAGGLYSAFALCKGLGLPFDPRTQRSLYTRGWSHGGLHPEPTIASRTLSIQDLNGLSTEASFDLTKDSSPLFIGLDLQQFSNRSFKKPDSSITIKNSAKCFL